MRLSNLDHSSGVEMPFPNYPQKYNSEALLTPQDMLAYRRSLGRLPDIAPPQSVILCLQRGLPERLRWPYPIRKVGRLIGDLYVLKRSGGKVAVMTNFGLGAPLISALAEELIAWGARRLISISLAAGLQPDLKPGDIVVCERALRDEGVSHHYLPPDKFVQADASLMESLVGALQSSGLPITRGDTWTIDTPYRETRDEVQQYQIEGIKTAEMETAGLFAIAQARGVQAASVLVVGDSLAGLRWDVPPDPRPAERRIEVAYAAAIKVFETG
jgi:uridine phosphorylase